MNQQLLSHRSFDQESAAATRPTTVFYSNFVGAQAGSIQNTAASQNVWDTVKAYLLLSVLFLTITAILFYAIQSKNSEFGGFLLMICFGLIGFQ